MSVGDWKEINRMGWLEKGLLVVFQNNYGLDVPIDTMVLHCYGRNKTVQWLCMRVYSKYEGKVSDVSFCNLLNSAQGILNDSCGLTVAEDLVMHTEFYENFTAQEFNMPYDLGEFPINP